MKSQDAMSPRMKAKFPKYIPRERQPGEALPQTFSNLKKNHKWNIPVMQPARPGSEDYRKVPSSGLPT